MKEDLWPFSGVFQSGLVKRCTHRGNLACLQVPTLWDTKERVPSSGTQRAPDRQWANSGVQFAGSLGAQGVYETHSWIFSHTEGPLAPVTTFMSLVLSTQLTASAQYKLNCNCFHNRSLLKMSITKQALLKYSLCKRGWAVPGEAAMIWDYWRERGRSRRASASGPSRNQRAVWGDGGYNPPQLGSLARLDFSWLVQPHADRVIAQLSWAKDSLILLQEVPFSSIWLHCGIFLLPFDTCSCWVHLPGLQ